MGLPVFEPALCRCCYPIGQGRTALGFSSVSRATGYSGVHTDGVEYGEDGGSDEIVWSSRIPDEKRLPTFWRVLSVAAYSTHVTKVFVWLWVVRGEE